MDHLSISVTELREKLSAILHRLDATGTSVRITRNGKVVAVLQPAPPETESGKPEGLFGARGALSAIPEEEIDEMTETIYQARRDETDRNVDI